MTPEEMATRINVLERLTGIALKLALNGRPPEYVDILRETCREEFMRAGSDLSGPEYRLFDRALAALR